jgi:hypothetical protein
MGNVDGSKIANVKSGDVGKAITPKLIYLMTFPTSRRDGQFSL